MFVYCCLIAVSINVLNRFLYNESTIFVNMFYIEFEAVTLDRCR